MITALMAADYTELEKRILARSAEVNIDQHLATAVDWFGVPPADITPRMRQAAKAINYNIIYGIWRTK